MAIANGNYKSITLEAGHTYSTNDLGNGLTASTVHQVFCISDGTINITPLGGGNFDWAATSGQHMDVILGACSVSSGKFIGFKGPLTQNHSQSIFFS